ncbi:MAG TPA: hypothetical protein VLY84_05570 [Dysgonamonadaceae bacterium]|jgi:hypothetical protein|nr:hypothetical protein [Dysgonamonadaceae bacterium]
MEREQIDKLLGKYWNCETSLEEEQLLQQFFSENVVPDNYKNVAPLFLYTHNEQKEKLSDSFDEKLNQKIEERQKKYITIKLFAPALKIAAMVAFILALSFSGLFWINSTKKQHFAETYNDPLAAYKEATLALDKLSLALQKSEKASLETLVQLNELNVDWDFIDSLNMEIYKNEEEIELKEEQNLKL